MQYGNMNLLHQQGLRIKYVKSKQSFDVHFESVQAQSLLFQYRIKVRLNQDVHVLYRQHKEAFLCWQSRMVWFQPSSNGNWLKCLLQVYCKCLLKCTASPSCKAPYTNVQVGCCPSCQVAFIQDFWTAGRLGAQNPVKQSGKAVGNC